MTISKRQLNRVLNVSGHAFVDPREVPHLGRRYSESLVRRRLFNLEDKAVIDQFRLFKAAFRALRQHSTDIGDTLRIGRLGLDLGNATRWRREMLTRLDDVLNQLGEDISRQAYDAAVNGYLASYYGRAWGLDVNTRDDIDITVPPLSIRDASIAVANRPFLEVIGDEQIWFLLGQEWRDMFADELSTLTVAIRRAINTGLATNQQMSTVMQNIADLMGVNIEGQSFRANFFRVQTITRSLMHQSATEAALAIYQANPDVISGVEFITSNDGRVCPICAPLAGKIWPLGSSDIIHPVSDTHPNCRCSLIAVTPDDLAIPDDARPSTDWRDWLVGIGLGFLIDDFLSGRVESSRV